MCVIVLPAGFFVFASLLTPNPVKAAPPTLHWNGTAGDGNWNTAANWDEATVPSDGVDLVFPDTVTAGNRVMHNDIAGLDLDAIDQFGTIDPYTLDGNSFTIANYWQMWPNTSMSVANDIGVGGAVVIMVQPGSVVNFNGVLTQAGSNLYISSLGGISGVVNINNKLSGSFSNLQLLDSGHINMTSSSTNDFVANVLVDDGTFTCGVATCFGAYANPVTVTSVTGFLAFENSFASSNKITLNGNATAPILTVSTGNIQLKDTLTVNNSNILDATSGGMLAISTDIVGAGELRLKGVFNIDEDNSAGYDGHVSLETATVTINNDFALGSNVGNTTIDPASELIIADGLVVDEPVTISGKISADGLVDVTGNITLATTATFHTNTALDVMVLEGVISGTGNITKTGDGSLFIAGPAANTYVGNFTLDTGGVLLVKDPGVTAITGDVTIGKGVGCGCDDLVIGNPEQINNSSIVTINASGNLVVGEDETIGQFTGDGEIVLTGGNLKVGETNQDFSFAGIITTAGDVIKTGTGTMTLQGDDDYTGNLIIQDGKVILNGLNPDVNILLNGGTVGGSGTVGGITVQGSGKIAPGNSPGILNVSGPVTLNNLVTFEEELNGLTPGTGYDQMIGDNTIDLNGATLTVLPGFSPANGSVFTIISTTGSLTGTFAGKANGSLFAAGTKQWRINYTSNTVTLTAVNTLAGTGTDIPVYAAGLMLISLIGFATLKQKSVKLQVVPAKAGMTISANIHEES